MPKKRKSLNTPNSFSDIDKSFLMLLLALLGFGVVMIYNATAVYAQGAFGGAYRFVILQLGWLAIGLLGFFTFFKTDLRKIKRIALPLFSSAIIFLGILALSNAFTSCEDSSFIFSPCINGAHRWLYINPPPLPSIPLIGVLGFQPSEFAKLALIIYLAVVLEKSMKEKGDAFMVFSIVAGVTAVLVLMQPNMSTAALIFLIGLAMYFVSGAKLLPLLVSLPVLVVTGIGFILSSSYRRDRLLTFLNPGESGELSLGYHIKQIQIALGSGGWFGLGFGQSRQKFQYLPEVASDSIFAIIGEEFGFIGTTMFVVLFSYFIFKGFTIAKESTNLLGRLLATGVTTWVAFQFFINVAAMTRIIPLTGVPLPLVSYGGSSLVFSLMGLGILANISARHSK